MKNNYVFVDLENVQPKNLELLKDHNFKIFVFVGSSQNKIPFDFAKELQLLGGNAEYIKINGNGPNALDFHIAFYIGQISISDPNSYFHIISKDTGFDPLVNHLKSRKIFAKREKNISEIPLLKISNAISMSEKIEAIIAFLKARGASKPRAIKTLTSSINSLFMKKLVENELSNLISELVKLKFVIINGTKVSYNLPN